VSLSRCRRGVTHDCVHVAVAVCTRATRLSSYCCTAFHAKVQASCTIGQWTETKHCWLSVRPVLSANLKIHWRQHFWTNHRLAFHTVALLIAALRYDIPCQITDRLRYNCCRIVDVATYTRVVHITVDRHVYSCCTRYAGVFVEFLVALHPRTLGHCFLRSTPIQHNISPDLYRHVGMGGVFIHYPGQLWSCISMLFWRFPFSGHYLFLPFINSSRCPYFVYILYTFIVWCVCCHIWRKAYSSVVCGSSLYCKIEDTFISK